jgi:hypothetical protein
LRELLEEFMRRYQGLNDDSDLNDYEECEIKKFLDEFCKEFYDHSFARRQGFTVR